MLSAAAAAWWSWLSRFGGFTAPLVATQIRAAALVLVAAMIPAPGEAPRGWPANTGFDEVMRQQAQR